MIPSMSITRETEEKKKRPPSFERHMDMIISRDRYLILDLCVCVCFFSLLKCVKEGQKDIREK